jgi:hypothetical protein
MVQKNSGEEKKIFVIMPFETTPTRKKDQLTAYFENHLKDAIEKAEFKYKYKVYRSGEDFNITDKIIKDLYIADVVIADLSGELPNPNVMYELGVRLAISEKPVILIREKHPNNRNIFDIKTYYTYPYDPLNYTALSKHLIEKLKRLETGEEKFASPVLKIIPKDFTAIHSIQHSLSPSQQKEDVLKGVKIVFDDVSSAFGPHGKARVIGQDDKTFLTAKQGIKLANVKRTLPPLENQGVKMIREVANTMFRECHDGTKTAMILFYNIIDYINQKSSEKHLTIDIIKGMEKAIKTALDSIEEETKQLSEDSNDLLNVVLTAAKSDSIPNEIIAELINSEEKGVFTTQTSNFDKTKVEILKHYEFNRGYLTPEFDNGNGEIILEDCHILIYLNDISTKDTFISFLEKIHKWKKSLLIITIDIKEDPLSVLLYNYKKSGLRCVPVKIPYFNLIPNRHEILRDGIINDIARPYPKSIFF